MAGALALSTLVIAPLLTGSPHTGPERAQFQADACPAPRRAGDTVVSGRSGRASHRNCLILANPYGSTPRFMRGAIHLELVVKPSSDARN
jgi:hypothetical protein